MKPVAALLVALGAAAHAQSTLPEWTLGASPQVTIGDDGTPRTEFQYISAVARLSNGNIAVVHPATNEIRVFDRRGAFVGAFGRKGQGPGEFEFLIWAGRAGDTALIFDGSLRRIQSVLLTPSPRLVGEQLVTIEAPEGESGIHGRLPDGRWLAQGLAMPEPTKKTGPYRIPGYIGVANRTLTGPVQWQPRMSDGDAFAYIEPGRGLSLKVRAFPAALISIVSGNAIWFGDGATDSLHRLDPATGRHEVIRLEAGDLVTTAMVDAARARELEIARRRNDSVVTQLRYGPDYLPKRLPSYSRLVAGSRGEVWVEHGTAAQTDATHYLVLSSSGTSVARLTTPAGFRIREVGTDYVAGVHTDDDGVQTVRVYSLKRSR